MSWAMYKLLYKLRFDNFLLNEDDDDDDDDDDNAAINIVHVLIQRLRCVHQ